MAGRLTVELRSETILAFSNFCAPQLNDNWVKNVWDHQFTDIEEEPDDFSEIYGDQNWITIFKKVCNICRTWSERKKSENENEGIDENDTNCGFWVILVDSEINYKSILALVAYLICKGQRANVTVQDRQISIMASTFYLNLLCIPGSSAFKLFHSILFQSSIKSLKLPLKIASRSRKRSHPDKGNRKGNKRSRKEIQASQVPDENMDAEENDNPFKETSDFDDMSPQDIHTLIETINTLMKDLIYCLETFSMRGCQQTTEQLIQNLSALTELELLIDMPNSPLKSPNYTVESLVPLCYKALSMICSSFHGDILFITKAIMKSLLPNLLMTGGHNGVGSSTTIPRTVSIMKDRTVSFLFSLIDDIGDTGQEALKILIQHMCTKVTDKAEYRVKVAQVVATLLSALQPKMFDKVGKWLQKFIHNSKVAYRMFGLELIGYMLNNRLLPQGDDETVKSKEFSMETLLCSLLLRCSDKSASVRAKALTIVALCSISEDSMLKNAMIKIFSVAPPAPNEVTAVKNNTVTQRSEINLTEYDDDDEVFQMKTISIPSNKSVNFPDSKQVLEMLYKRAQDDKVAVRKAAIQVIENVICLNEYEFEEVNVEILREHCMDPTLLVRKQALQSINAVLVRYPSNEVIQKHWIHGVLPLVFDKETTIQQRCLELLEKLLLNPIIEDTKHHSKELVETAWKIVTLISNSHNQDNQRYLQKACQEWAKNGNIKPQMLSSLKNQVAGPNDAAVWFLLSSFAISLDIKDTGFIIKHWKVCYEAEKSEGATIQRIIQVIGSVASRIKVEDAYSVIDDLKQQLSSFSCPPELIAVMLCTFTKLYKNLKCNKDPDIIIRNFFTVLLKATDVFLSSIILESNTVEDDELIVRHLFTLGEVSQLCPEHIPRRVFLLIQSLVATPCITGPAPVKYGLPLSQLSQPSQQPLSQFTGSLVKPKIRAHAFITLGKLCLQNEDVAKKSVAAMARELSETSDTTIRNNIVVILSDLCVRYTILVDPYMPNVTACLKDPSQLVRRQTLILLIKLLQEDYIKWKGIMFYQLLTVLVDENIQMREFAEYCFTSLLLPKQPLMMYHHFVEAVFHFNAYKDHESYNKFKISDKETILFNMSGPDNRKNRNLIYRFMLESMSDEHKFFLTQKLCQDILSAVSDGTLNMNDKGLAILQDTFYILYSDEIKLSSLKVNTQEQADDAADMAAVLVATAKKTLITQVVKKNVIENIVPIVISLKHKLEQQKSPLLRDLMLYLKELMKDYRHEVKDIMSADKQLAKEIEYDLQRFDKEQQELEKRNEKEMDDQDNRRSSTDACPRGSPNKYSSFHGDPKTPRNTRAVLHSARILIESAKRGMAHRIQSARPHKSCTNSETCTSPEFKSFHTPSSSRDARFNIKQRPQTERVISDRKNFHKSVAKTNIQEIRKEKSPLREKQAENTQVQKPSTVQEPIDDAVVHQNVGMEVPEPTLTKDNNDTEAEIMKNILNNSSVLKVCLQKCDTGNASSENFNKEKVKQERLNDAPVRAVNTTHKSTIQKVQKQLDNVTIADAELEVIKEEEVSGSTSRNRRMANKYRAISTPVVQSSKTTNISFAHNISAIDFSTPIHKPLAQTKRLSKRKK